MKHLDKELDSTVGHNIAILRKELKLSQRALAEKIGITQRSLCSYEIARNSLPISLLPVFANFFKISVEELLSQPTKSLDGRTRSVRILKSLETIEQMPENEQNLVLGMIDSLSQKTQ